MTQSVYFENVRDFDFAPKVLRTPLLQPVKGLMIVLVLVYGNQTLHKTCSIKNDVFRFLDHHDSSRLLFKPVPYDRKK